jgi:hypothetical protein
VNQTFIVRNLLVSAVALSMSHAAKLATGDDEAAAYRRLRADYRADKAACAAQAQRARDICVERARARKDMAQAELETGSTDKPAVAPDQTSAM